jgi:hypothetical protein
MCHSILFINKFKAVCVTLPNKTSFHQLVLHCIKIHYFTTLLNNHLPTLSAACAYTANKTSFQQLAITPHNKTSFQQLAITLHKNPSLQQLAITLHNISAVFVKFK